MVSADFPVRNPGDHPVRITSLQPDCDCTSAEAQPEVIPAGGSGIVHVTVKAGEIIGTRAESVMVETDEAGTPPEELDLKVIFPAGVSVEPQVLHWDVGAAADAQTAICSPTPNLTKITGIEPNPEFDVSLEPIAPGSRYAWHVRPKSTAKALSTTLLLDLRTASGRTYHFPLHAWVIAALNDPKPDSVIDLGAAARIETDHRIPLRRDIFSIAADTTLGGHRPDDPVPQRVMTSLRPTILRVPGGDSMNLWDWNAGMPASREHLLAAGESEANPKVVTALRNRARYGELMGGPMVAERWVQFAKLGDSDPLWGLNVTTESPAATRTFVEHLRAGALPADRFELGNELYLGKVWKRQIPTPEAYAERAAAHAKEVRAVLPDAKLSVCITVPLAPLATNAPVPPANAWNHALMGKGFYDAVVLHDYAMSGELGDLAHVSADEYARWAMVRCSPAFLRKVYGEIARLYPKKEIWVTEWNLNNNIYQRDHPTERARYRPARTMLSGLYVASFLLNTAAYPSNVSLATYWQICGEPEFGLIAGDPPREEPSFKVFQMLAPIVQASDQIAPVACTGGEIHGPGKFAASAAQLVQGYAFYRQGRLWAVAFVNFSDHPFDLDLPNSSKATLTTLQAPELLSSWGEATKTPMPQWAPPVTQSESTVSAPHLSLPARSFSVIKLTPVSRVSERSTG